MSAATRQALAELLAESGDETALSLRALRAAAEWCAAAAPPVALELALAELVDAEVRRAEQRAEGAAAELTAARAQLDAAKRRHDDLQKHLAANRTVARAFPNPARVQDLLTQAERILGTVDAALANAIAQRAEQKQPRLQVGEASR